MCTQHTLAKFLTNPLAVKAEAEAAPIVNSLKIFCVYVKKKYDAIVSVDNFAIAYLSRTVWMLASRVFCNKLHNTA